MSVGGTNEDERPLTTRAVLVLWWPLAASWLMMGLELPLVNAAIARLPDAREHLAAFGSLVFPLSLLIEAPIIPLLSASTALCKDAISYAKLRLFMIVSAAVLTLIHAAFAFTPLLDLVALSVFDMEPELLESGRTGMQLMLPWTPAIAYRRFQQGVLIRAGHSRAVGIGTVVRLVGVGGTLLVVTPLAQGGPAWLTGTVVAASAIAVGVTAEAIFSGFAVRGSRAALPSAPAPGTKPWSWRRFGVFYGPLTLWSLVGMAAMPITSAAIGRMPREAVSFAVWPAVNNLVFLLRSSSFALTEVVVATLGRPGAKPVLARFARRLGLATSGALVVIALTPLAGLWFSGVQGLDDELVGVGMTALLFACAFPFVQSQMAHLTGRLVHAQRTRGIGEAVLVFTGSVFVLVSLGTWLVPWPGAWQAGACLSAAALLQTLWLLRADRRVQASTRAANETGQTVA